MKHAPSKRYTVTVTTITNSEPTQLTEPEGEPRLFAVCRGDRWERCGFTKEQVIAVWHHTSGIPEEH